MKAMPLALLLTVLLGLGACSPPMEEPDDATTDLEAAVQQKEEELRKARDRYDRQLTEFTVSVRERHAREIAELEQRMKADQESFTRTIRSLQGRLDAAERALTQTKPQDALPPPLPPAAPEPSPAQHRIITRTTPVAESPSIDVSGVSGAHALIGSHTTTRLVETDEEYRDAFGDMKKRKRPEAYEIPEYGYQASATLANTNAVSMTLFLRCGQGETKIQLAPGEERRVTLDSARGAPLVIRTHGRTQVFNVTYP